MNIARALLLAASVALALAGRVAAYDEIGFLEPLKLPEMSRPRAVAASAGRYYVLDEKRGSIYILDADGRLLKGTGHNGSDRLALSGPKGLAVSPDGRLYVADVGNSRVQILDKDGNFLGHFGSKGAEPGRLKEPESVAVGADGRVYVADTGNDRVEVFTAEGVFLFGFGEKGKAAGQMRAPTRLAVDNGDFVYVLDSGNDRLLKFGPGAKFVKEFNLPGKDFALDDYGFFYILDPRAGKVKEQGPEGSISGVFGSKGSGPGQMKAPAAIAVAPDGTVLVLDPGNGRVLRARLSNKLKLQPVAHNAAAKLFVSGPVRSWDYSAQAIAAGEKGTLYAFLAKEGSFVAIGDDGKAQLRFGRKSGKGEGATKGSRGLAVGEKLGVFVADTEGDKMQRFTSAGKFQASFAQSSGLFDSKKKEGRVRSPRGVAVSEKGQGMVYVADAGNKRVDIFSPDGTFLSGVGPALGPYTLEEPVGVAWDKAGFVYVLDRKLKKVFKCEPSGGFVLAWGGEGAGNGEFVDPIAVAFDGRGYVHVLDRGAKRVAVFSRDGGWVTNFFSGGQDESSLDSPESLAAQGDRLVVSDPGRGKLLSFALHSRPAPPASISTSVVEGVVGLAWAASTDPWLSKYRILRSNSALGPFDQVGLSDSPSFKDAAVEPYRTYFYRVASEAGTGDVGPASLPAAVFIPGAFNRSPVEISTVAIGNIFSANYKYYLKNPVGTATVTNNVDTPFRKLKLTFRLKDFMDFGTDTVIAKLDPQESVEVPLMATLNNKILEVTEDTPIQAEFSLTYFEDRKERVVSVAKPLRVYSRNAITWDKPERIATFITSNDTPALEFQKRILNEAPDSEAAAGLNPALVKAMRLWSALGASGVKFQASANNPFEKVSEDPAFPVDYTQFPRETLKRKSGQCDDLTTLLSAMLEGAGVKTVLLDYPGHIALMFDTGAGEAAEAGLPEPEMVRYDDSWWIPLEATLAGASFVDAHRQALNAYREMAKAGKASLIDPRKAWAVYEPATMPATEWSAEIPPAAAVAKRFDADAEAFSKLRYRSARAACAAALAKDAGDVEALNRLGILEAEAGDAKAAAEEFAKALAADPEDVSAINNFGSLAFQRGDYKEAEEKFLKASALDAGDAGIWLNLAKTAAKTKDAAKAKEYGAKAVAIEPSLKTAAEALTQ